MAKCRIPDHDPNRKRDLGEPTGCIWVVEFSPVGAKVREPRLANVYRCLSCKSDIVFVAKEL